MRILQSILKTKIKPHRRNIFVLCAGAQLDLGAKERTYGTLRHGICNTKSIGYDCNDQGTLLLAHRKHRRKDFWGG